MANTTLGVLVNPRTGEPCEVFADDKGNVVIVSFDGTTLGKGYFDSGNSSYAVSEEITGYPRVHTPDGVTEKGAGWGTCLYTGLCLASYLATGRVIDMQEARANSGQDGGISSMSEDADGESSRSPYADAWWRAAVQDYGLAEEYSRDIEKEVTDTWEDRGRDADPDIEHLVESTTGNTVTQILRYNVSVEYEYMDSVELTAEAYPYANALAKNLVLAEAVDDRFETGSVPFTQHARETLIKRLRPVSLEAILALNVGVLHERDDALDAFYRVLDLAEMAGATRDDIRALKRRFEEAVDVEFDLRRWVYGRGQIPEDEELPFEPPPEQTAFPFVSTETGVQLVAPVPIVPVLYGEERRENPVRNDLERNLAELQQRRIALGWASFALDAL